MASYRAPGSNTNHGVPLRRTFRNVGSSNRQGDQGKGEGGLRPFHTKRVDDGRGFRRLCLCWIHDAKKEGAGGLDRSAVMHPDRPADDEVAPIACNVLQGHDSENWLRTGRTGMYGSGEPTIGSSEYHWSRGLEGSQTHAMRQVSPTRDGNMLQIPARREVEGCKQGTSSSFNTSFGIVSNVFRCNLVMGRSVN